MIRELGVENKITSIVTANASNMKAAWRIVNQKYRNVFTYGCVARGLNLLFKDIVKSIVYQLRIC